MRRPNRTWWVFILAGGGFVVLYAVGKLVS